MTSIAPITTELKPCAPAAKAKPKDQSVYIKAKHCEAKVQHRICPIGRPRFTGQFLEDFRR
jgi:hypothetical protein